MFLARKISLPKWQPHPDLAAGEIRADAITADLRTVDNGLSSWHCGDNEPTKQNQDEAALAIASTMERANKVDLVWFDGAELERSGHVLRQTKGLTPVSDLRSRHFDICNLDYTRLGDVASRIAKAVEYSQYRQFTRKRVLELLADAVEQGRVDLQDLKRQLRQEVQNTLDQRSNT